MLSSLPFWVIAMTKKGGPFRSRLLGLISEARIGHPPEPEAEADQTLVVYNSFP